MMSFDQEYVERVIDYLNQESYLFSQFQLCKKENHAQLLGQGGFSYVYEMQNKARPQNHYALKVMGIAAHEVTSEDFKNTTRLQTILCQESPYIMRVLDSKELCVICDNQGEIADVTEIDEERWEANGLHLQFILMEKLEPVITQDRFKKVKLVHQDLYDENEVIRFAMQIGLGISVAHNYGILHRDIKLENIFWNEKEDEYKLGDFGIAKEMQESGAETVVYTDGYGAPEIERRLSDHYNATADIYSFGISLYLLLNSLRFPGSDGYYSKSGLQYNPEFVFPAPENASVDMTRILRKMCSYYAKDRYQTMGEVLADLTLVGKQNNVELSEELENQIELETETYREKALNADDSESKVENQAPSREEQKREQKILNTLYRIDNIKYFVVITVLATLFMIGIQMDVEISTNWTFWVLPFIVLFEGILQKIKEFQWLFGAIAISFIVYSCRDGNVTLIHILLLLFIITGIPLLSISGGIATGFWLMLILGDYFPFVEYLGKFDLSWLFIAGVFLASYSYFYVRVNWEKISDYRIYLGSMVYDKIWWILILVGIMLLVIQYFDLIEIPEMINKIHFIRTGIVIGLGTIIIDLRLEREPNERVDEQ